MSFLLAGFILLSLLSYYPSDPSWSTAIDGIVCNYGGIIGSYTADTLLRWFGIVSYSLVFILNIWSWRLWRYQFMRPLSILFLPLLMIFMSLLISLLFDQQYCFSSSWGGIIGTIFCGQLTTMLSPFYISVKWLILPLFLIVGSLFLYITNLKLEHLWQQFLTIKHFWVSKQLYSSLPFQNFPPSPATSQTPFLKNFLRKYLPFFFKKFFKLDAADPLSFKNKSFSGSPLKSLIFEKPFSIQKDLQVDPQHNTPLSPFISSPHTDSDLEFEKELGPQKPMSSPNFSPSSPLKPLIQNFFPTESSLPSPLRPLELKNQGIYQLPPLDFLKSCPTSVETSQIDDTIFTEKAKELEHVLKDFGVKGEIIAIHPGPVVTLYELKPAAGTKSARVIGLADDIARSVSAISARVAVIPGKNVIGIELPNAKRATVYLKDLLANQQYERTTATLSLVLGKDISGAPIIADLARMPHLLVAGTTGSGKSVAINTMILSLLYRLPPEKCKFIMIDPKMLELSVYDGIPHLLSPVVTDPKKAIVALKWVVKEMENRYRDMSKLGVRNIAGYNSRLEEARERGEILTRRVQTGFDSESGKPLFEDQPLELKDLPFIVVIVDEMADLMLVAGKEIESAVQRLAQMARAAGIHLIMATQRPSVDVITGTIKANFPTRISFQVTSKIDSRTILGEQGAEQLLGQGDMLYMSPGGKLMRVHGPYTSDEEVEKIVKYLKVQAEPHYDLSLSEDIDNEEDLENNEDNAATPRFYQEAVELILRENKVSTSFIQRHFSIGYNSAAKIVDAMERKGIISPPNHTGKREIIG